MNQERYLNFMALTVRRRDELDQIVERFLTNNSINLKNDIIQEFSKIGFEVHKANFRQQLDGIILVNENEKKISDFGSNKIIFYNANADLYKTRFILAHELAHYISEKENYPDRKVIVAMRDHDIGYSKNIAEQEMDYMAASMLIPREELKSFIVDYFKNENLGTFTDIIKDSDRCKRLLTDDYFIQLIQKEYRVDQKTVTRRLEEIFSDGGVSVA